MDRPLLLEPLRFWHSPGPVDAPTQALKSPVLREPTSRSLGSRKKRRPALSEEIAGPQ